MSSLARGFEAEIMGRWSFISKILIREVKRLQALGDTQGQSFFLSQRYTLGRGLVYEV